MNKKTFTDYKFVLSFVALIWVLELINLVFAHQLNQYALVPRKVENLFGIFSMHFLHWNLLHIISNSLPLFILGFFVSALGKVKQVTFIVMITSGSLVWLFARNGIHAGASALVMGYWGYLLSNAIFDRRFKNILIAIFTIVIYGGIVFSLLDFRSSVSFEGHFFGLIAGILSAGILRRKH